MSTRNRPFSGREHVRASLRGVRPSGADLDGADLSRAVVAPHDPAAFRALPARAAEVTFEADFAGCSLRNASLVGTS